MRQRINRSSKDKSHAASWVWTIAILAIGAALVALFFYVDRHGAISNAIRSWGVSGILLSIVLMMLFCVIPVPSEFLMIMNMKVFGVWWGIFYTWIGAMMGATVVFFIARYFGGHLLAAFISQERLKQVDGWVRSRGPIGLLLVRLVPLPFIVVNYAAGIFRSIRPIHYLWTTGIGLLPYDIGAALVYLGLSKRYIVWIAVGGVAVVAIWVAGYLFRRNAKAGEKKAMAES